ncbi:MED6-domain-containing protein [Phlebopus sp. FC_14]|nr:MED6-domain-containing protein [Phlebopus sp. FC_14]
MDVNGDLHPADDYSHRFFIWHEWIQANGPLTAENVFDYFTTSMFYDKQSNNQVLRMQTMHTGTSILNESEELRRFTGIEFALVHAQPPSLFIIHKRDRLSPEEVRPIAAYFVINNRIYQSPDVYTLLSNRLLTSVYSLQSSLDVLRKYRPDYTARTGFIWPIMDPSLSDDSSKKQSSQEVPPDTGVYIDPSTFEKERHNAGPGGLKKQQNNMLMLHAMRTTAMHSNTTLPSRAMADNESSVPDAQAIGSSQRSSVTPAPATRGTSPKVLTAPTTQDNAPTKGSAGGGKRKKKRRQSIPL